MSLFNPPKNGRALVIACLLGAIWLPFVMIVAGAPFLQVAAGILLGPGAVFLLEVIFRPFNLWMIRQGDWGWAFGLPVVFARVVASLVPVWIANLLFPDKPPEPPPTPNEESPFAGPVDSTRDGDVMGPRVGPGDRLLDVDKDGTVFVRDESWGWVSSDGYIFPGRRQHGLSRALARARYVGDDVVANGETIGRRVT